MEYSWAQRWLRKQRRRRPARWASRGAIQWPCCRSAATTWRIILGTGWKWILERVEGRGATEETPIGYVPAKNGLTMDGMKISDEAVNEMLRVNPEDWELEMEDSKQFLAKFGARLPRQIGEEQEKLARRFQRVVSA